MTRAAPRREGAEDNMGGIKMSIDLNGTTLLKTLHQLLSEPFFFLINTHLESGHVKLKVTSFYFFFGLIFVLPPHCET